MNPLLWASGYKQIVGLILFGIGSALELLGYAGAVELKDFGGVLAGVGAMGKAYKHHKGLE